jgi:anaerobic selenocysteine-containing dehydrogenase
VRGDKDDPFSRGHIRPKAAALRDVHDDPDRVREPLKRVAARVAGLATVATPPVRRGASPPR